MPTYYISGFPVSDELYHHGIKGQRWGIRRYQNPDGTLTAVGKARYGSVENFKNALEYKAAKKQFRKTRSKADENRFAKATAKYTQSRGKESAKRGQALLAKGRTKGGAIGRGIGRQVGIEALKFAAVGGIGALSVKTMMTANLDDPETQATIGKAIVAGSRFVGAMGLAGTAYNVAKTARQYKDIKSAEERLLYKARR